MIKIDCLGEICPVPVMMLKKHQKAICAGERVMVITDHSCAKTSISDYCHSSGLKCSIEEVINGVWEISIQKRL